MNERPNIEQIKTELTADIVRVFGERRLSDAQASELLTLSLGEVRRIRAGEVDYFVIDHLISILNRLSQHVTLSIAPEPEAKTDSRPIWDVVDSIMAAVPPGEWDKVPADLGQNHDHYLYGAPKRD
jgi:predicted XRE-type DNA-binding protein